VITDLCAAGVGFTARTPGETGAASRPPHHYYLARGEHLSIEHRVQKLEEEIGSGEPCLECGHVPGQPFASDTIDFDIRGIDEPLGVDEFCGACGRQLVFVVRWGKRGEGGR
jgi:bacterioferritin-associated ferredoxin